METEVVDNQAELSRAMAVARSETLVAANNARFHANVVFDQDLNWHANKSNQSLVVAALNRGGFSAEYRSANGLRIEWGHALLSTPFTAEQLRPQAGERASTTVDEALHSSLCRKVVRSAQYSRYFDPTLTKLSPEDILERARANVQAAAKPAAPSASAQAVQRAVAKLTQGETGASLSRLSTAAKQIEASASLDALQTEIEGQREKDDSLRSIDALFGEINSSAKSTGEDPLEALELELKKGPTHRQLREVEAMIDEVDMAATPNTRRKNQMARKAAKDAAATNTAVSKEGDLARLELTQEALARTSRAKLLADETFEKEARRLARAEEEANANRAALLEREQASLVRAAEEAERAVEEANKSVPVAVEQEAQTQTVDAAAPEQVDPRVARAQAEARDRALKEAALAEEQRNLRELKAAQMEALARQRELEEREAAEERAKLELEERAKEAAEQARIEQERAVIAQQLKAQEAKLAALQEEAEREAQAKIRAAQTEAQQRKQALESLQKQAASSVPVVAIPEEAAFTPIAASKGGLGNDLETPLTLAVKDEMNLDAMLGELNFDLDVPRDNASFSQPTNKHLAVASSTPANLSRNSAAVRELDGLDDMMTGMDAFTFDTSSAGAAAPAAKATLNDSRTGGLKINDPVRSEDLDVEAALGSMDFSSVAKDGSSSGHHAPVSRDFSVVVPHNTAAEVTAAAAASNPVNHPVAPASTVAINAFDDFKIDTIDTSGTTISSSDLNVDVNLAAIGASPASKTTEPVQQPKPAAQAEAPPKAAEPAAKVEAPRKEAEVIQDEKSKAGFGDKKAMFESKQQPVAEAPKPGKNAKKNKKKNKNKK